MKRWCSYTQGKHSALPAGPGEPADRDAVSVALPQFGSPARPMVLVVVHGSSASLRKHPREPITNAPVRIAKRHPALCSPSCTAFARLCTAHQYRVQTPSKPFLAVPTEPRPREAGPSLWAIISQCRGLLNRHTIYLRVCQPPAGCSRRTASGPSQHVCSPSRGRPSRLCATGLSRTGASVVPVMRRPIPMQAVHQMRTH